MTWLLIGLIIGVAIWAVNQKRLPLKWYDWVLLVLAIMAATMAIQTSTASLAEHEPKAAFILFVAFGVPAVILAAIVAVRQWRSRSAAAPST